MIRGAAAGKVGLILRVVALDDQLDMENRKECNPKDPEPKILKWTFDFNSQVKLKDPVTGVPDDF